MTRQQAIREAERIAGAIQENAQAIHMDAVSWEAFSELNLALWREAEVDPQVVALVRALLRNDPNWREEMP